MTLTEEQKLIHTSFRKYLRVARGKSGNMLNMLMIAAEEYLPELIIQNFDSEFVCIYDNKYSLQELLLFANKIRKNDELKAAAYGFISLIALEEYIKYYAEQQGIDLDDISIPEPGLEGEEIPDERFFTEGDVRDIHGIRYERDRDARKKCIEYYGCKCAVCGFDFESIYGELGKGFIEVHHIKPLSQRGGEYVVDPVQDLVPLCSNCHSMAHRGPNKIVSIEDLKLAFEQHK